MALESERWPFSTAETTDSLPMYGPRSFCMNPFRSIAQRINKQGWNIVVRTDTRKWPVADCNRKRLVARKRMVLAANTTDGKYFLSVIGPGSIQKVKLQITRTPQIHEARWFETSDEYFRHFPQCRTLRGRIVTKDFWEEKVSLLEKQTDP